MKGLCIFVFIAYLCAIRYVIVVLWRKNALLGLAYYRSRDQSANTFSLSPFSQRPPPRAPGALYNCTICGSVVSAIGLSYDFGMADDDHWLCAVLAVHSRTDNLICQYPHLRKYVRQACTSPFFVHSCRTIHFLSSSVPSASAHAFFARSPTHCPPFGSAGASTKSMANLLSLVKSPRPYRCV